MKKIITIILILFIFFGCAKKDAFSVFHLQPQQTKAVDNVVYSKLKLHDQLQGIVSVLYLNKIYPKKYKNEAFYIVFYLKQPIKDVTFFLNQRETPLEVKKLSLKNPYTTLLDQNISWSQPYFVSFLPVDDKKFTLSIQTNINGNTKVNFSKTLP